LSALLRLWEADCRTKRYKHSLSKGPLPLYKRHRVIVSVLNECLGLYNKPTAEVHPGHKLTGPEEEQQQQQEEQG